MKMEDFKRGKHYKNKISGCVWLCRAVSCGSVWVDWVELERNGRKVTKYYSDLTIENWEEVTETQMEKETMSNKLYQVKGQEVYGIYLATNSNGQYVLEEKGTGKILTVKKDEVEEVKPYTISVKFVVSNGNGDKDYSYLAEKDQFSVGDLLYIDTPYGKSIAYISAVDTKSDSATKEIKARKFVLE